MSIKHNYALALGGTVAFDAATSFADGVHG